MYVMNSSGWWVHVCMRVCLHVCWKRERRELGNIMGNTDTALYKTVATCECILCALPLIWNAVS